MSKEIKFSRYEKIGDINTLPSDGIVFTKTASREEANMWIVDGSEILPVVPVQGAASSEPEPIKVDYSGVLLYQRRLSATEIDVIPDEGSISPWTLISVQTTDQNAKELPDIDSFEYISKLQESSGSDDQDQSSDNLKYTNHVMLGNKIRILPSSPFVTFGLRQPLSMTLGSGHWNLKRCGAVSVVSMCLEAVTLSPADLPAGVDPSSLSYMSVRAASTNFINMDFDMVEDDYSLALQFENPDSIDHLLLCGVTNKPIPFIDKYSPILFNNGNDYRARPCFRGMSKMSPSIANVDVSNAVSLRFLFFQYAGEKIEGIKNWDLSKLSDMSYMFAFSDTYNDDPFPVSSTLTPNLNYLDSVFRGCKAFNRPLSNWNEVLFSRLSYVFCDATSFNQDLSGWNFSKCSTFTGMFKGATSFNQDLSGWNFTEMDDEYSNFFETSFQDFLTGSGMDVANIDSFLIAFNAKVTYDYASNGYGEMLLGLNRHGTSAEAQAAEASLTARGWAITVG